MMLLCSDHPDSIREVGASCDVVERTYQAMIAAFIDLELAVHDGMPGDA